MPFLFRFRVAIATGFALGVLVAVVVAVPAARAGVTRTIANAAAPTECGTQNPFVQGCAGR